MSRLSGLSGYETRGFRTGGGVVIRVFTPVLVLHVVVAVLGLGSILSIAIVAAGLRRANRDVREMSASLAPLLRLSAVSLAAIFLSGALMDALVRGSFHDRWWFRLSALLLVLTGALHARARRIVRRGLEADTGASAGLRGLERLAYGMSALIAAITVLMETRPF